jgi:hypothetical protein
MGPGKVEAATMNPAARRLPGEGLVYPEQETP